MKKTLIGLILITGLFPQSNFTPQMNKPPVIMKHLEIVINHYNDWVYDTLGVAIPDTFKIKQSIEYVVYLYDEDDRMVRTEVTQGNLLPYMTSAETQGIQTFLDSMVAKAQKLVPVP
jgi:hypothetical protein